jgi:hypothetical protein
MSNVSLFRLYLMRAVYLMNFVLMGLDVWPALLTHSGAWGLTEGAAYSLWAALSLLSVLGLKYPLQMLPLLLFQVAYKIVWLLFVAWPNWESIKSSDLMQVMFIGLVIDLVIIPWAYVFRSYILAKGDRWRRED